MSRGDSLVGVLWLLVAVSSLIAEHGLSGVRASAAVLSPLERRSVLVARGLRCSEACGICPIRD